MPDVLLTFFGAPYVLGTDLVDLLEQTGGDKAINAGVRLAARLGRVLLDPFRFLDGDAATDVPVPALEAGEEKVDDGDMGAIAISCCSRDSSIRTTRSTVSTAGTVTRSSASSATDASVSGSPIATVDDARRRVGSRLLTEWSDAVPEQTPP